MNFIFYFGLIVLGSMAIVAKYRWRSLYVITLIAYVQNFVLAYLYTNHMVSRDPLWCALLAKEILLLVTFIYSCRILLRHSPGVFPRPLFVLGIFTLYCVVRIAFGIVFFHDGLGDSGRMLRMICFPFEVLCVTLAVVLTNPNFFRRFLARISALVVILAGIAIFLTFFVGRDFWAAHVNIASYNIDVKGDDPIYVDENLGVSGTGLGRDVFLDVMPFRAMGTFGDPLAMGFVLVVPIALLAFYFDRKWWAQIAQALLILALFLTFSRSAWILVYLTFLYVLLSKKKYVWATVVVVLPVILLVYVPPLAQFAMEDVGRLSWSNPGGEHAEGIVWFYQRAFTDFGNILGKGVSPDVQKIPENGYAFLLEHLGFFAYFSFLWFLCSFFRWFRQHGKGRSGLILVCEAVLLGTFVVMHFSQYPFAFIEWLLLWLVLGAGMGQLVLTDSRAMSYQTTSRSNPLLLPQSTSTHTQTTDGTY